MTPELKQLLSRLTTTVTILIVLAVAGAVWQRQAVYDWWQLRGYTPPGEIAQFADDTTMTDGARRLYYVNHPELKDKASFPSFCPTGAEQTVVLGCYIGGQQGIYLLDIDNQELAGIEQVTAAHEMLHAVYERLSPGEKDRLERLLQKQYDAMADGPVKQTVDSYRQTEPHELPNEMHSIFATQVKDLPAELEDHYRKYFSDRSKIVDYYLSYEAAFTSRQDQIKSYDAQLSAWQSEIETLESTVDTQQNQLRSLNAQLNRYRASGDLGAYNNGVDAYNRSVGAYNANLEKLKTLIARDNQMVESRNAIAFEERSLVDAITSAPASQE